MLYKVKSRNDLPWKNGESLFSFIINHIDENGFFNESRLPEKNPITVEPQIEWPLGGKEGIIVTSGIEEDIKLAKEIYDLLLAQFNNTCDATKHATYNRVKNEDCMFYINDILKMINGNKSIDMNKLFDTAIWMVFQSRDSEVLKLGIMLLSFFKISEIPFDDNTKLSRVIFEIGKCPEFTYYVLYLFKLYPDISNMLTFRLAKYTVGWGRVFSLIYLEAETQEIKDWVIDYGFIDDENAPYVALACAQKCELWRALHTGIISSQRYKNSLSIVYYLIDRNEQFEIEKPDRVLFNLLRHSLQHCDALSDLILLYDIEDFIIEAVNNEELDLDIEICSAYIHEIEKKKNWEAEIYNQIRSEDHFTRSTAIKMAERYELDIWDILFEELQLNPEYDDLYYVLLKTDQLSLAGKVIEFAEEHIDMYLNDFSAPLFIIQALRNRPYIGQHIIERALVSSIEIHRSSALNVVESWGTDYIPLGTLNALQIGLSISKNERSQKRMKSLLKHSIDDGRDFIINLTPNYFEYPAIVRSNNEIDYPDSWNIGYTEGQLSDYRKYRMECRKTDDVINLIIFISYIDIEEAWDEELLEYLEKEGLFVKMSDSFPYKIETEVDSNDNVFWSVNITVCDKNHSYIHSPIGMTKFS